MLKAIPRGQTSNLIRAIIYKNDGTAYTGLTGSTSGLIIGTIADNETATTTYTQAATHIQTIATLGTYAAPSASECRFAEVDSTNHPGLYEFQFADARFAVAGSTELVISVSGAANIGVNNILQQIIDPVRGLGSPTAIPNAAAGGKGGLPILDATNGTQLQGFGAAEVYVGIDHIGTTATGNPTAVGAYIGNATAAIGVSAGGKITEVVTVDTVTNLTNAPTAGDLTATMKTSITAAVPTAAANATAVAAVVPTDASIQADAAAAIAAAGLTDDIALVLGSTGFPAALNVAGTISPDLNGTYLLKELLADGNALYALAGVGEITISGGVFVLAQTLTTRFAQSTATLPWLAPFDPVDGSTGTAIVSIPPVPATDPNGTDNPGTAALLAASPNLEFILTAVQYLTGNVGFPVALQIVSTSGVSIPATLLFPLGQSTIGQPGYTDTSLLYQLNSSGLGNGANQWAVEIFSEPTTYLQSGGNGLPWSGVYTDQNNPANTAVITIALAPATDGSGNALATADNLALVAAAVTPIRSNTAQGGTSNTITLDTGASATDNDYVGDLLTVGDRDYTITGYVGSTKVATIEETFVTTPTSGTPYQIKAADSVAAAVATVLGQTTSGAIGAAVWNFLRSSVAAGANMGQWVLGLLTPSVVANISLTPAQAALAGNQIGGSPIQAYEGYALINYNQSFNNADGTPANFLNGLTGHFKVFTPGSDANLFTPISFTYVSNVAQFTIRAADNSAQGPFRYEISYTDSGTGDPVLIATNSYTIGDGGTAP